MFSDHFFWVLSLALLFEFLLGDPRSTYHPVVMFGQLSSFIEKKLWADNKVSGVFTWLLTITLSLTLILLIGHGVRTYSEGAINTWLSIFLQALLLWVSLGWKSLLEHVQAVSNCETLDQAKERVGYIVGRDTTNMTEQDIHRASIESLAENTSDSIIAPLFWFAIFGVLGAWLYRMINTLDAIWGYKHQRYFHFGWFAAKADDVANFIPARLTALFMLLQKPSLISPLIHKQAKQHSSPNAGYPETAMAFLLSIQLGGPVLRKEGIENRAWMGLDNNFISKDHINTGIQITNYCCLLTIIVICMIQLNL